MVVPLMPGILQTLGQNNENVLKIPHNSSEDADQSEQWALKDRELDQLIPLNFQGEADHPAMRCRSTLPIRRRDRQH